MRTKHRNLPAHVVTRAVQAHTRSQCVHDDHDIERVTTWAGGCEEREGIPRDVKEEEVVYTPSMIGDLVRLALKGFLDFRIDGGELRVRMRGETLGEMLENGLERVEASHASGAWRDDGDTLRLATRRDIPPQEPR